MVFCYKTITESPPRKLWGVPWSSSLDELASLNCDFELDCIPKKEWQLLKVLARKREEKAERENLAEQFRKLWLQEKEGREQVEAQTNLQYKSFIKRKRKDDLEWLEHWRKKQTLEQQMKKSRLLAAIRHKERETGERLAWREDQKATELENRVLEDETRGLIAAERRKQQQHLDQWRKKQELEHSKKRRDDANKRKNSILRNSSMRLATSSAMNHWEIAMQREQLAAADAVRRAQYSALAMIAEERGEKVTRALNARRHHARVTAEQCERLREVVRYGRY